MATSNMKTAWPSLNEELRKHVSKGLGMDSTKKPNKYQVYDGNVYERRTVHKFVMSDVEDVEIYIAQPLYEWQQTDHGKWVMANAKDPTYHINADPITYGYQITVTAHITPKRWTEYVLRGWFTG
jgi:hypothetical protein